MYWLAQVSRYRGRISDRERARFTMLAHLRFVASKHPGGSVTGCFDLSNNLLIGILRLVIQGAQQANDH